MSRALIEIARTTVDLTPRPIEPSWIIEGKPEASACTLSQSADGTATTIVWHCTEGKFNWYYDFDETILILEGSIVLESDTLAPTRYSPGDVILFRKGAHARWHVDGHVKKLAFCRTPQPALVAFAIHAVGALKRMLLSPAELRSVGLSASR